MVTFSRVIVIRFSILLSSVRSRRKRKIDLHIGRYLHLWWRRRTKRPRATEILRSAVRSSILTIDGRLAKALDLHIDRSLHQWWRRQTKRPWLAAPRLLPSDGRPAKDTPISERSRWKCPSFLRIVVPRRSRPTKSAMKTTSTNKPRRRNIVLKFMALQTGFSRLV